MARWPLSPLKVWDAWKEVTAASSTPAALIFAGDPTLTSRAGEMLAGQSSAPLAWSRTLDEMSRVALGEGDILVVFAQPPDEDRAVEAVRRARARAAAVAVDEEPGASHEITWYSKGLYRVSFSDSAEGWEALRGGLLDAAGDHLVSLARRYPALRDMAAHRLIRQTARQNAAIGAAFFIPGTDMPLMTVNQIKMVLSLAVVYGEELSQQRAVEIVSVIGAGLGLRAVARQFAGYVPGPGWAVKGAIAYSGTRALGEAAIRYFQEGAPATPGRLTTLAERVKGGVGAAGEGRLGDAARRARQRVDIESAGERLGSLSKRLRR